MLKWARDENDNGDAIWYHLGHWYEIAKGGLYNVSFCGMAIGHQRKLKDAKALAQAHAHACLNDHASRVEGHAIRDVQVKLQVQEAYWLIGVIEASGVNDSDAVKIKRNLMNCIRRKIR